MCAAVRANLPFACVRQWVDKSDPAWWQLLQQTVGARAASPFQSMLRDHHELLYSLRSLYFYAPWIRRVYLVTNGQIPPWLDTHHPAVTVIRHAQLFDNASAAQSAQLPTFNPLAIDSVLHRIPGLSDWFLYLNHDLFLARPISLDLFLSGETYKEYRMWRIARTGPCETRAKGLDSLPADLAVCHNQQALYADHLVARATWDQPVTHWSAHMPHLFQVTAMRAVEAALGPALAQLRQHRLKQPTDVNIFVQQQAWRRMLHARTSLIEGNDLAAAHGVELIDVANKFLTFDVITDCLDFQIAFFWGRMHCKVQNWQAYFVSIDDNMRFPGPVCVRAHARHYFEFLDKFWPTAAPWERPAEVAAWVQTERTLLAALRRTERFSTNPTMC